MLSFSMLVMLSQFDLKSSIEKSQVLLMCRDTAQIDTRLRKEEVLQEASFISGSEIQLHTFTTGTCDLQE